VTVAPDEAPRLVRALGAPADHARAPGLPQLRSGRGGTALPNPASCAHPGWMQVGLFPGDVRDEHRFRLRLHAPTG